MANKMINIKEQLFKNMAYQRSKKKTNDSVPNKPIPSESSLNDLYLSQSSDFCEPKIRRNCCTNEQKDIQTNPPKQKNVDNSFYELVKKEKSLNSKNSYDKRVKMGDKERIDFTKKRTEQLDHIIFSSSSENLETFPNNHDRKQTLKFEKQQEEEEDEEEEEEEEETDEEKGKKETEAKEEENFSKIEESKRKKKLTSSKSKIYSDKFQISSSFNLGDNWTISKNSNSDLNDSENVSDDSSENSSYEYDSSEDSAKEFAEKKAANIEISDETEQKNNCNVTSNNNYTVSKYGRNIQRKYTVVKLNGEIEEIDLNTGKEPFKFIPYHAVNIARSLRNKRNNKKKNTSSVLSLSIDDINDLPAVSEKVDFNLVNKCAAAARRQSSLRLYSESNISPRQISPRLISPREISPRQISPRYISPRYISPRPISSGHISPGQMSPRIKLPVHGNWRNESEIGRDFTFAGSPRTGMNRNVTGHLTTYNYVLPKNIENTNECNISENSGTSKRKISIQRECSATPIKCESENYYQTPRGIAKFVGHDNNLLKFQLINTGIICSFSASEAILIKSVIKPNIQSIKENLPSLILKHADNMILSKLKNEKKKKHTMRSRSEILIGKLLETGKTWANWNHLKKDGKNDNADKLEEIIDAENIKEQKKNKNYTKYLNNNIPQSEHHNITEDLKYSSFNNTEQCYQPIKSQNTFQTNMPMSDKYIMSNKKEMIINNMKNNKLMYNRNSLVSIYKKSETNNVTMGGKTNGNFDPTTLLCKPGYVGDYLCRTDSSTSDIQKQEETKNGIETGTPNKTRTKSKSKNEEVRENFIQEKGNTYNQQKNQIISDNNYFDIQKMDITMKYDDTTRTNNTINRNRTQLEENKIDDTFENSMYHILHNSPTFHLDLRYMNVIYNEILKRKGKDTENKNMEHIHKELQDPVDDKTSTPTQCNDELENQNTQQHVNISYENHEPSLLTKNKNETEKKYQIFSIPTNNKLFKNTNCLEVDKVKFSTYSNVSTGPSYVTTNNYNMQNPNCMNDQHDNINMKIDATNVTHNLSHEWGNINNSVITDKQLIYVKNYYTANTGNNTRPLSYIDINKYGYSRNDTHLDKINQKENYEKQTSNTTTDKYDHLKQNHLYSKFIPMHEGIIRYYNDNNLNRTNIRIKNNTNKFIQRTNPQFQFIYFPDNNTNNNNGKYTNANNNNNGKYNDKYNNGNILKNYVMYKFPNPLQNSLSKDSSNNLIMKKKITHNYLTNKNWNMMESINGIQGSTPYTYSSSDTSKSERHSPIFLNHIQ